MSRHENLLDERERNSCTNQFEASIPIFNVSLLALASGNPTGILLLLYLLLSHTSMTLSIILNLVGVSVSGCLRTIYFHWFYEYEPIGRFEILELPVLFLIPFISKAS